MADWVHCNKCYIQPASNCKESFYLTNCGHIFCGLCCPVSEKPQYCHICHANCSSIILNGGSLKEDIKCYFQDQEEIIKQFVKVNEFQKYHRTRFITNIVKESAIWKEKYNLAKEYSHKLLKTLEALKKDNQRLKNAVKNCISSPATSCGKPSNMFSNPIGSGESRTGSFIRGQGSGHSDRRNEWLAGNLKQKNTQNQRPSTTSTLPIPQEHFRTPNNRNISFQSTGSNNNTGRLLSTASTNRDSQYNYSRSTRPSPNIPLSDLYLVSRGSGSSGRK